MTGPSNTIDKIAIIGAGISGVVTAAHLLNAGLEATVFERNNEVGGIWCVIVDSVYLRQIY